MSCKIKSRIVNGIMVYGIIDDSLSVLVDFKYKNISPIEGTKWYLLTSFDDRKSVFFEKGMIVDTDYTSLTYLLKDVCTYYNAFFGEKNGVGEVVQIFKGYDEKTFKLSVMDVEQVSGKEKDVRIDEIKLEENLVCLYTNTPEGKLKGYLGHHFFGDFKPRDHVKLEGYSFRGESQPYIPNGSCVFKKVDYAIITSNVNGRLKKGILVRGINNDWEELSPCLYDEIVRKNELEFETINYVDGNTLKGLIRVSIYYEFGRRETCVMLREEFRIEPKYNSIRHLEELKGRYRTEPSKIYYIVEKNKEYGLYRARCMEARGSYDYLSSKKGVGVIKKPFLEKMLPCQYDSINSILKGLSLPLWKREDLIETFEAKKNGLSSLVFERKDSENVFLKTDCELTKINHFYDNYRQMVQYILTDKNENQFFVDVDSGKLKETKKYKNASITHLDVGISLLVGRGINGIDLYDKDLNIIDKNLLSLNIEKGYYLSSKKKIWGKNADSMKKERLLELSVYDASLNPKFSVTGKEISYSFSKSMKVFFINVDGRVIIKGLDDCNENALSDLSEIAILGNLMLYKKNTKFGLLKLTTRKFEKILEPLYEKIEVLESIQRAIVTLKLETGELKKGVFETTKGNICIDCIYDEIVMDENVFSCTLDNVINQFDVDGFPVDPKIKQI